MISRVSSSSRISASILRPGSNSVMSVVSHAGPWFNLARRRLKNPRTPGLSASFVMGGYDTGSDYPQDGIDRLGRPQFGAHHRRRLARPARQFPGHSRACGPTPDRVRETLFNWLQHCHRGHPLPRFVRRLRCARTRGPVPRARRKWCSSSRLPPPRAPCRSNWFASAASARAQVVEMGAARYLRTARASPSTSCFSTRLSGRDALAEYVPLLDAGNWLKPGASGVPGERARRRAFRRCPPTGNCSNRSRRARWGIIWRASTRGHK